MPAKMMTVEDWREGFGVVDPAKKEVLTFALWDRQDYVSAATTDLTFFTTRPVSRFVGNLQLAGQLPNGWAFLIQAIGVAPMPLTREGAAAAPAAGAADGPINEILRLIREGIATLTVGPKEYGSWPIWKLPAAGGMYGQSDEVGSLTAPATAQYSWAANGVPDPRAAYTLPVPVVIPPQYDFSVLLEWPAAETLLAPNDTALPFFVVLDGEAMRPSQ